MRNGSQFGSFELAPNDRLWVEPTSIYGLLNLFYDPVSWVSRRHTAGSPTVLEVPYVIALEPHGADGVVASDEVLVQGIDRTCLLTARLGGAASQRLFDHLWQANTFEEFERAVLHGAQRGVAGSEEGHFRSHVVPALFSALYGVDGEGRMTEVSSARALYERYRASQAGKTIDVTEVRTPSGRPGLFYVHFCIWPNPADAERAHSEHALAEKQIAVALFQTCAATDPTFLSHVLNSGRVRLRENGFEWNSAGEFTEAKSVRNPETLHFAERPGGIRLTHIGKDLPTLPVGSAGTLDSACEVLVGVMGPDGNIIYYWEAVAKPYE